MEQVKSYFRSFGVNRCGPSPVAFREHDHATAMAVYLTALDICRLEMYTLSIHQSSSSGTRPDAGMSSSESDSAPSCCALFHKWFISSLARLHQIQRAISIELHRGKASRQSSTHSSSVFRGPAAILSRVLTAACVGGA